MVWMAVRFGNLYMGIMLNSIVIIDLYLTLKNPFYPRAKRGVSYWTVIIIFMVVFFSQLVQKENRFKDPPVSMDHVRPTLKKAFWILLPMTIVSFVGAVVRLFGKGTSSKMRRQVVRVYLIYFLSQSTLFLYMYSSNEKIDLVKETIEIVTSKQKFDKTKTYSSPDEYLTNEEYEALHDKYQ
jgi:hypothetical protein